MKKLTKLLALLMCGFTLFGTVACGGGVNNDGNFVDNDEFYTINWYMPVSTTQPPQDLGVVQNKVNAYLKEKINANINITAYSFAEYRAELNLKTSNAEEFDLMWTDFESYQQFLEMEALYPLDNLLETYAPAVLEKYPDEFWDQTRYVKDGKIYAAMNNQILPRSFGIEVRDSDYYYEFIRSKAQTILNGATGVDANDVEAVQAYLSENFTLQAKLDLIKDYLVWLRANKAGANESTGGFIWGMELLYVMEGLGFDALGMSMAVPGVVDVKEDGTPTVINQFKTEEFKLLVNTLAQWYKDGFIPSDVQTGNYDMTTVDVGSSRTWTPKYVTTFQKGGKSRTREVMQFGNPYYIQSYINGTQWSISATSANPARTMKFINLLHTDAYLHNLLKLGIEGEHYTVNDNGQAVLNASKSSKYYLENVRWIFGDETLGITLNTQTKDLYERVTNINNNTELSPTIGFAFDRNNNGILTKIQLTSEVVATYISNLGSGAMLAEDEDYYNKFIAALEEKGCNEVIAEKQAQLDAWLAKQAQA